MIKASVGSQLRMENAYIDEVQHQAICCWDAPNRKAVEDLFEQAGVKAERIREVVEYQTAEAEHPGC